MSRHTRRHDNRGHKLAWVVTFALGVVAAAGIVRALRRPSERPAEAHPVPMDSNDGDARRGAPGRSTEASGVAGVIERAVSAGYDTEFEAEPGAVLRCGKCDAVSSADTFERRWQNRLEGASDPDDMAQVSGLVCPACGARGTFVSLFGPGAGTDAADVMVALPRPLGDLPIVAR